MTTPRKLLYTRGSECIQPLRALVERQTHRALVAWALECAKRPLAFFEERVLQDLRPREALARSAAWARGEIKMPAARNAILAAHRAAGEARAADQAAEAAARAVGHACATVHAETHALGLAYYWLTAVHRASEPDRAEARAEEETAYLLERLCWWEGHIESWDAPWAAFLLRDVPNKEKIKSEKEHAYKNGLQ